MYAQCVRSSVVILKLQIVRTKKIALTTVFSAHLAQAQEEHRYYLDSCNVTPEGSPPEYAHYTFDFAEQLTLPHHSRQVGPMYFKVGRKVQLFYSETR